MHMHRQGVRASRHSQSLKHYSSTWHALRPDDLGGPVPAELPSAMAITLLLSLP
jgi:hypothetical protein